MWLLSSRIYEFGPKTIEAASAKNVTEATLHIGELAYANAHQREVRERLREQSVVIRYQKVVEPGAFLLPCPFSAGAGMLFPEAIPRIAYSFALVQPPANHGSVYEIFLLFTPLQGQ